MKKKKSESNSIFIHRARVLLVLVALMGVGILYRSFQIQVIGDSRLKKMSQQQFHSKILLRPKRGLILDRHGVPLAVNTEIQSLAANPKEIQSLLKEKKGILNRLSRALRISKKRLQRKISKKREFAWIKRHLTKRDIKALHREKLFQSENELQDGFWLVKENKRVYPQGSTASNVIGFVNVDSAGLEGVELWKDNDLKGQVSTFVATRDALGRPTFIQESAENYLKQGKSVHLTLDSTLQYSVEQILTTHVEKTKSVAGIVIVMDATSGEILTLATKPSFNPNRRGQAAGRRRNRAFTDGFEPGSTMKPLLVASALQSGWPKDKKIWGEKGSFEVQGKRISEAETHEKFEWLTLKDVIRLSSNVGAAKLGLEIGKEAFLPSLEELEFGETTEVGFPGEISGWLPDRDRWKPLTLANLGFGQGLFVTPIQMVRSYASIINGGWLIRPSLIIEKESKKLRERPKRVFSRGVTEYILDAMESVVGPDGTGKNAFVSGYRIAGKTATAQVVDPTTRRYSKSRYISSFIGFARHVNPKLVIMTLLDYPKGIYYSSETAAPLFKDVFLAVASRFGIPHFDNTLAQKPLESVSDRIQMSQSSAKETPKREIQNGLVWIEEKTEGTQSWKMPDLRGLSAREVLSILEGHEFKVSFRGFGVVEKQTPQAGMSINDGQAVEIRLSE